MLLRAKHSGFWRTIESRAGALPIATIEWRNVKTLDRAGVNAAGIHAHAIGMRARRIKRFYTAHRTEMVPRDTGIESVSAEHVTAAEQFKSLSRYDEMEISGFGAN
jgi:hypothetical protein